MTINLVRSLCSLLQLFYVKAVLVFHVTSVGSDGQKIKFTLADTSRLLATMDRHQCRHDVKMRMNRVVLLVAEI